jgi:hypothetical protein
MDNGRSGILSTKFLLVGAIAEFLVLESWIMAILWKHPNPHRLASRPLNLFIACIFTLAPAIVAARGYVLTKNSFSSKDRDKPAALREPQLFLLGIIFTYYALFFVIEMFS